MGWVFGSMFFGAMLPYWFSALTMKSVGKAASDMVEEIKRQLREDDFDSDKCIAISTQASLKEMIAPGLLVMLTPIICGVIFGTRVVAGILPGALLSGIQLAISMSNTGGAWDNAKKQIEGGYLFERDENGEFKLDDDGEKIVVQKGSSAHGAS